METEAQVEETGESPQGNGTSGGASYWHSVDWARTERNVRRLRQRIFKAAQDGDLKRVRNLQKLMLRSHSNTLQSVKRVTQTSTGRRTAGIDGETVLKPEGKGRLARSISNDPAQAVMPVRRVYIPKANGKMRPLGIPIIKDRVQQARVKNALEPEREARFEAGSYGFRPGRSCHDAIEQIFRITSSRQARRTWVLDADLASAFSLVRDLAGLESGLELHCLRHTYITHLIEFGYPERFVQDQVGHRYAATTALYTWVSDEYRNRLLEDSLRRRAERAATREEGKKR
ncbi:reverse transcriptase N-terminal domain-containing protein [Streptomyces sp. NPDC056534]|uniref:reverse transcriptase N-terminal domain-containing protein n=1 Tax=Streptomyces sp. NPDC056534 TaxID=3345857 RepID=UPI0036964935